MAGKLCSGKLTLATLQPVTTKSQRSAADAKSADCANIKTAKNRSHIHVLLIYSINNKLLVLPPSAPTLSNLTGSNMSHLTSRIIHGPGVAVRLPQVSSSAHRVLLRRFTKRLDRQEHSPFCNGGDFGVQGQVTRFIHRYTGQRFFYDVI